MFKQMFYRKFGSLNLRTRLLVEVGISLLLMAVLAGGMAAQKEAAVLESSLQERLMATAKIMAISIDASSQLKLRSQEDENKSLYQSWCQTLRKYVQNSGVEYAYTMYLDKGKIYFILDSDPLTPAHVGEEYKEPTKAMLLAFRGRPTFDSDLTTDQWGETRSGYAPIFDSKGHVVAILGVDIAGIDIRRAQTELLMSLAIPFGLFTILIGAVVFAGTSRLLRPVLRLVSLFGQVAKTADFSLRIIDEDFGAEFKAIIETVNHFLESLSTMVRELQFSADRAENAARFLTDSMGEQWDHSGQVAAITRQTRHQAMALMDQITPESAGIPEELGTHLRKQLQHLLGELDRLEEIGNAQAGAVDEIMAQVAHVEALSTVLRQTCNALQV